jgi:hypothetical protein
MEVKLDLKENSSANIRKNKSFYNGRHLQANDKPFILDNILNQISKLNSALKVLKRIKILRNSIVLKIIVDPEFVKIIHYLEPITIFNGKNTILLFAFYFYYGFMHYETYCSSDYICS